MTLILIWIHHQTLVVCVCVSNHRNCDFFFSFMSNVYMRYKTHTIHPFVRREKENRSQNIHNSGGSGDGGGGSKDTYSMRAYVCIKRAKLRVIYTRCAHAFIYICMVDCDCIGILFDLFNVRRYVRIRWATQDASDTRRIWRLSIALNVCASEQVSERAYERLNGVSAARTNLRAPAPTYEKKRG